MDFSFAKKLSLADINAQMSLRLPQYESIQVLHDIMQNHDIARGDLKTLESEIATKYPLFKEFERDFPSLTFALATGVGKTRLMAACMLYLNQNFGIKNFFVVAPNLTIYEKLKRDFGDPSFSKYVFNGLGWEMDRLPTVVTGEDYNSKNPRQSTLFDKTITINIFNIAKFNRGDGLARVRRLNEVLGDSYFNYLSKLPDLVMMMDESHHYRADAGFKALNELDPLLGLEFTATPQIEGSKGAVKFRNVVYEYALAKAIGNYVKTPWVATKKNFVAKAADEDALDRIKLIDGITIHRNTQAELAAYAENEDKKLVRPFVLVVCKNTAHASYIMSFIRSNDFFDGYYKDKVIEIHSAQKGAEKDANIEQLLRLEDDDNKIEIVVHVNILKEGWDVNNLYTIIPLRVAASLTLREQTIGRGLRLPYGQITGNEAVDRLTIVAHDLFNDIVRAANENSIIKKQHIIDIDELGGGELEAVKPKTVFDERIELISKRQYHARSDKKKEALEQERRSYELVGRAIEAVISKPVNIALGDLEVRKGGRSQVPTGKTITFVPTTRDLDKPVVRDLVVAEAMRIAEEESHGSDSSFLPTDFLEGARRSQIESVIEEAVNPVIELKRLHTIDIPAISLVAKGTGTYTIQDFDLNPHSMRWLACLGQVSAPADEIVLENLKSGKSKQIQSLDEYALPDGYTQVTYIIGTILDANPYVTYEEHGELLAKLALQLIDALNAQYPASKVNGVLMSNIKEIAREISDEITFNAKLNPPEYEAVLLKSSTVIQTETYTKAKGEEVKKYTDNVPGYALKRTVFGGFEKCCTSLCKFDSDPERIFSVILESDKSVQKWLKPTIGQLSITYNNGERYKPDFIVETADGIYIIEIKSTRDIDSTTTTLKSQAAEAFCHHANLFNSKLAPDSKPWRFALINADKVSRNMTFAALVGGGQ